MPSPLRLSGIDIAIVITYVTMIVGIGWRAALRRKPGSEDYILAGRTLTLPIFVAALVTCFYGGVLGVGEYTYLYGLSNWLIQGVPYYFFAFLYASFLAKHIRAHPGLTIADHLERAYGKKTAFLGALLIFILASPADEMLMLGTLTHWMTDWNLKFCLVSMAFVSACFLFTGGLRSGVWTAALEFCVMFAGFSLILPFAYREVGGLDPLRAHLPAAHLEWNGGRSSLYILSWFFIALWTFVDPSFHQRVCAAKDVHTARRGILLSIVFWCLFDFMTTAAGLYSRALLPDLDAPLTAFPALAGRLLPPVVRGFFFAGMISSILAALSATSFLAAVSLAKDGLGRYWKIRKDREEIWIRWGLLATLILSIALAMKSPSVVGLWFTVGSTTIPGLLVPLISCYFERLRIPPTAAFLCSLGGWGASLAAWAMGNPNPSYPGLAVSLAIWLWGKLR